jgi:hypothetical protein
MEHVLMELIHTCAFVRLDLLEQSIIAFTSDYLKILKPNPFFSCSVNVNECQSNPCVNGVCNDLGNLFKTNLNLEKDLNLIS